MTSLATTAIHSNTPYTIAPYDPTLSFGAAKRKGRRALRRRPSLATAGYRKSGSAAIPCLSLTPNIIKILRCECERHEASPLQRAIDIRVYVEAVKSTAAREIPSISLEELNAGRNGPLSRPIASIP